MQAKTIQAIVQALLLSVIAVVPFVFMSSLYFPYVSGKAYLFRVLVAIAFFFWVWLILKEKREKRKEKRDAGYNDYKSYKIYKRYSILVIAIALFFVAQVVAALFGVDPGYSFFGSIERAEGVLQYGFWLMYFLMFVSVFREERDWKKFFSVFIITAFLVSAFSWLTRALSESSSVVADNPNLFGYQEQLFGIFGNPAYFAAFLLFAIGFSLIAYERKLFFPGPVHHALLAATGLFVLTLVFTQVRGGYVALAGGIGLFSLLSLLFLRKERKKLSFAGGVVLLAGVLSLGVLFLAKDSDFVQERRFLWRITEVTGFWESDSVRERILNWNIALKAAKEKPLFGYGPENYGAASNKYYDYRIGVSEPWFDRAHNQALDTLATSGIVGFSAYLFWLGAAGFLIFQISRQQKLLSFLLGSAFFAYFLQGFFLFDTLAVYLGLFPFLAFLIYQSYELPRRVASLSRGGRIGTNVRIPNPDTGYPEKLRNGAGKIQDTRYGVLIPVAVLSIAIMYFTAAVPWKANAAIFQFLLYSERREYEKAEPFLQEAFGVQSPYASWEVRKRAGWQFSNILEYEVSEETQPEKIEQLKGMYEFMAEELEQFITARPTDPQMYYVLGRVYRFGAEKLGFDTLGKAEVVFQKALSQSDRRVEYFNEYTKVLLLQDKFEEAERITKDYVERVDFYEYFPYITLGHLYFSAEKYDLALQEYEKAREAGYSFVEVEPEYARYIFTAETQGDYQAVVDMVKLFLERWGPDADTYFNLAVGYLNLEEKEKAKDFFLKSVELKPEYEEYRSFFVE